MTLKMRQDVKINFAIILLLILICISVLLLTKYNANKKIDKILKVKSELEVISKRIDSYHITFNKYPTSLREKRFVLFIDGTPLIDQFDPERNDYRYQQIGNEWKVYSVGPNKIDDNGTAEKDSILLDIVVSGP